MKLSKLLEKVEIIRSDIDLETEVIGVTLDTRKGCEGALYGAIPSLSDPNRHGKDYIPAAIAGGAKAVLLDVECDTQGLPGIYVKDARRAVAFAASAMYGNPADSLTMIGITGTKGKTSTTHYVYSVLTQMGIPSGLIGTNEILYPDHRIPSRSTTPEAPELYKHLREMVDYGVTHVVMEVSSHALDVGRVDPIRFKAGAFLNLSQDHLDYFGTMENLAAAKARFSALSDVFAVNGDDKWASFMTEKASGKVVAFSMEDDMADLVAKNVRLKADSVSFDALTTGSMRRIRIATPGRFTVYNGLCAVSVLLAAGLDLDEIANSLSCAAGVRGRAEVVDLREEYTVMVDYAHSPESMKEILKAVRSYTEGKIITVFGCGGNRDRAKRPIMGSIAYEQSDMVVITSDNPRFEKPEDILDEIFAGIPAKPKKTVLREVDRAKAVYLALQAARKGDLVLIAGKGHEDYQEIEGVKYPMDDRDLACVAAAKIKEENEG
ncbi:MAG: UDP-N-acetylmuramoyl-L-alanyl-D-glutamate--2,6-diaminopimelate ligase [Clostridia bacterium]|nr:UDP-N-acetylmuramoyl-L-alanyl-D-glutamate--2,6-diaminopimelate ligase [Clostridia bacterium]